jgi:serine/threonine-protein kinase
LGITVEVVAREYNDAVAKGRVITQNVKAGAPLPASAAVGVVVSRGGKATAPPPRPGVEREKIQRREEKEAVAVGVEGGEAVLPRRSKGKVLPVLLIAVSAALLAFGIYFGTKKREEKPRVELVAIPYIVDADFSSYSKDLETAGLAYNKVVGYKPDIPEGYVISVNPEPGTSVAHRTKVAVIVCDKSAAMVPSIAEATQEEADKILTGWGYKKGKVEKAYSEKVPTGRVIEQNPL